MKVLWLCNVVIPQVCKELNVSPGTSGGWMTRLADYLDNLDNVELYVCAPISIDEDYIKVMWGNNSVFYGFKEYKVEAHIYLKERETIFSEIIQECRPDLVHVFGTEFPQTLSCVKAFSNPEKTIIQIQGLVSYYSKHYEAFLPLEISKASSFRDLLRKDNIVCQKRKFDIRGSYEIEALRSVKHVIGRTDWDYICAKFINPQINYHYMQEALREEFYEDQWLYESCERHTVLLSQGSYPIKGLHLALEAIVLVKKVFPDVKLIVCGDNIIEKKNLLGKLREGYYYKYIKKLIKKYNLQENVFFTGSLKAVEMKEQLLKANVFLSASSIENSPNSLGEAMMLGVPSVVSYVGGVMSLADHGKEVYFYQADAPYMAAGYIIKVFDKKECQELSESARKRAICDHDFGVISSQLLKLYNNILSK